MATSNPHIAYVKDGVLHKHDGSVVCRVGRRTGWLDWLKNPLNRSFTFTSASTGARCTVVREERTGRNNNILTYWRAWRSINGAKRHVFLGKSIEVTMVKLEAAAGRLAQGELSILEDSEGGGGVGKIKEVTKQGEMFVTSGFKVKSFAIGL